LRLRQTASTQTAPPPKSSRPAPDSMAATQSDCLADPSLHKGAPALDAEGHPQVVDHGPSLVADIVGRPPLACLESSTVTDVADLLFAQNRTAVAVASARGEIVGAITENDILQAYEIGVPRDYPVEAWLRSDCARLPNFIVGALTVLPEASLTEAAAVMRAQASGDFACHHLLVKGDGATPHGILSALDLTRALCRGFRRGGSQLAGRFTHKTVADVMKPRASLPICEHTATMSQVVQEMLLARQNCVLVAGEVGDAGILGVVTPRDILRAFVERTPGSTPVVNWLRALHIQWEPRAVRSDAQLAEAADVMAANGVHHVVVAAPPPVPSSGMESAQVVGLVSSTDIAYSIGAAAAMQ